MVQTLWWQVGGKKKKGDNNNEWCLNRDCLHIPGLRVKNVKKKEKKKKEITDTGAFSCAVFQACGSQLSVLPELVSSLCFIFEASFETRCEHIPFDMRNGSVRDGKKTASCWFRHGPTRWSVCKIRTATLSRNTSASLIEFRAHTRDQSRTFDSLQPKFRLRVQLPLIFMLVVIRSV